MSHSSSSFMDIWMMLTTILTQDELEEATSITKLIWNRRNEVVHQKGFSHPNSIITKAKEELKFFKLS